MKVLIINSVCGNGSKEKIVAWTYKLLKENKDVCKVASGIGKVTKENKEDVFKLNNKFGYYIRYLLSKLREFAIFLTQILNSKIYKQ